MRYALLSLLSTLAVAFAVHADDRPYGPTKITVAVGEHATVRFLSPSKLDDAGRWDEAFDSEAVATDPAGFTIRFTGKVKGTSALILTSGGKLAKVTIEVVDAVVVPPPPPGPAPVPIPLLPSAPLEIPPAKQAAPKKVGAVSRPTFGRHPPR